MEATVTWPFPGFDAPANGAGLAPAPPWQTAAKLGGFSRIWQNASSNADESASSRRALRNRLPSPHCSAAIGVARLARA